MTRLNKGFYMLFGDDPKNIDIGVLDDRVFFPESIQTIAISHGFQSVKKLTFFSFSKGSV